MNPKNLTAKRQARLDELQAKLGRDKQLTDDERLDLLWLIFDEALIQRGVLALSRETQKTGALESTMDRTLGVIAKYHEVQQPSAVREIAITDAEETSAVATKFFGKSLIQIDS